MAALTPISRTPVSFYVPAVAAAGAFAGLLVGTSQGSSALGVVIGAALAAAMALLLTRMLGNERAGRWGVILLMLAAGFAMAGLPGAIIGALFGWFFGWFTFWLFEGRYRARLAPYLTPGQVLWHFTFRVICGAIFIFLITPILVVMPLSFNAENFFTNSDWQSALRNSILIAPAATILSVSFGTLAAIGLSQPHVPFRRAIMATLISPMIVPLIISAAGMYFFYSRIGLQGTYLGVVLAHAALGIPFVIITVTATLVGFDRSLTRAAANMGANPVTTFFRVQMPLILPGVISGALFAFITSFDEVVVVLFVGSAGQKTLPWQMFTGLREQISPTILAVATILVAISIVLLTVVELLRRRSERLRGMSPG